MTEKLEAVAKAMFEANPFQDPGWDELPDSWRDLWIKCAEAGLRAAQQDGVRETWRPIETAPKDGTKVLLVEADQPSDIGLGWWMMGHWRDYGDIGCNGLEDFQPTHWMPLPPRPAS